MDVGLVFFPIPGASAQAARGAEDLGYASLLFTDTQCLAPDVWGQLMLAARDTQRIQLGTGVTNSVSRDPAVTAAALLALQIESGGRALCGIGRGDSSMAKIGRRPARVRDFETYLIQLQAYLCGESVDRSGTPSRIEWLDGLDVAKPPVEVAATGPRVIEVAARHADRIAFAVGADVARLAGVLEQARKAAAEAGRDPDTLRYGAYVNCVVHPDAAVAREAIRGGLAVFVHFSGFPGYDTDSLAPAAREVALRLRETYDFADHGKAGGSHSQAIPDDFVDAFGIAGPADRAVERFRALADLGLDFVHVVPGSRDMRPDVAMGSLQALARDVLPQLGA